MTQDIKLLLIERLQYGRMPDVNWHNLNKQSTKDAIRDYVLRLCNEYKNKWWLDGSGVRGFGQEYTRKSPSAKKLTSYAIEKRILIIESLADWDDRYLHVLVAAAGNMVYLASASNVGKAQQDRYLYYLDIASLINE